MLRDRTRVVAWIALAAVCLNGGCSGTGPALAPVRGRILVDGKPVSAGRITFYPEQGNMAQGSIIADGEYRLTTFVEGDGAILGKHQVVIKATRIAGSPSPKSVAEELRVGGGGGGVAEGGSLEWIVPEQYSDRETSPLTAVVKAGGNQINFEIPSK